MKELPITVTVPLFSMPAPAVGAVPDEAAAAHRRGPGVVDAAGGRSRGGLLVKVLPFTVT